MNGLGYSSDGGETFPLAMTMDGSIVADFITSGVMNADVIRAGIIQDITGLNHWNLDTGEFRLASTTTVGGSTVDQIANSAASQSITTYDSGLDQQKVFNRLTNNGATQGIILENGNLYINASIIKTGTLADAHNNVVFDLINGILTMKSGSIELGSLSEGHYDFEVTNEGRLFARSGIFYGNIYAVDGTFGGQLVGATGDFEGSVSATDFINARNGESIFDFVNRKLNKDYLSLAGLEIKNGSQIVMKFNANGVEMYGGAITWKSNISTDNISGLSTVATTGDYNSLLNRPEILTGDDVNTYIDDKLVASPTIVGGKFYATNAKTEYLKITSSALEYHHLIGSIDYTDWYLRTSATYGSLTLGSALYNIWISTGGTLTIDSNIVDFTNATTIRGLYLRFTA
jgi:hypothetical protein